MLLLFKNEVNFSPVGTTFAVESGKGLSGVASRDGVLHLFALHWSKNGINSERKIQIMRSVNSEIRSA